jgi:hypothetical protein
VFFRRRICGTALKRPSFAPFVATASTGLACVIFLWEAARVLFQLARVDAEEQFTAIFDKQLSPMRGTVMITAANVIRGGARIVPAKPHRVDFIATEVLRIIPPFNATSARR